MAAVAPAGGEGTGSGSGARNIRLGSSDKMQSRLRVNLQVPGQADGAASGAASGTSSPRTTSKQSRLSSYGSGSAWLGEEQGKGPRPSMVPGKIQTKQIRYTLAQSSWYHSDLATRLRSILMGKEFALVMIVALMLALFMPDIWVLAGVNSNLGLDVTLTIVLAMFAFELITLTAVDASYLLSFFQIMDIVGTISMVFDISYLQGVDATAPTVTSNNDGARENLMLLRAARAAKIGARAGRLSRVLRILRFLPFLTGGTNKDSQRTGIASLISSQLANLLATRVACLTIILVMVIPVFEVWTFPQQDYSLQTWVARLSKNLDQGRVSTTLTELDLMTEFYSDYSYGPYMACTGWHMEVDGEDVFNCNASDTRLEGWVPALSEPPRHASAVIVHTNNFMVAFNMHYNSQVSAGTGMATTFFIIFIMVFSGLALSSVVTELAVRPLERMLGTVRQIATTVFKISADVEQVEDEDEPIDIDSSNEMKLLEKVVQKLAIVADLQSTKQVPQNTADMGEEDIGVLNMMQGKNIVEEAAINARKSMAVPRKKAMLPSVRVEDFGVSQEVFQSWAFNTLPLTKAQRNSLAMFTISRFHDPEEGFVQNQDDLQVLQKFVAAVEKEYLPVPFHSFAHAVDVTHAVARIMRTTSSEAWLDELEQYSLLIAAIAHDIGHPGVNNGFLSEVGHDLALQYNDRSPLENMHCAKLYALIQSPQTNVFSKFTKEQYKEARQFCIETILHTDMMVHQTMVKDLQMIYQMNAEVFAYRAEADAEGASLGRMAEAELFSQNENKLLAMECILHSADVSNPCRVWEVTKAWAWACLEEFFVQGDQEKTLGIPVQFLNDRDKLNKPNSQIGFIEFMIAPFVAAQIRLWPSLYELGSNLGNNLGHWEEMWAEETHPAEEERMKVRARVQKVKDNMADAISGKTQ